MRHGELQERFGRGKDNTWGLKAREEEDARGGRELTTKRCYLSQD